MMRVPLFDSRSARRTPAATLLVAALIVAWPAPTRSNAAEATHAPPNDVRRTYAPGAPKFYPDDPIAVEPDSQDASGVEPWEIDLAFDLLINLFGRPGDQTLDVPAQNVNTIDEVPDGSWFTNRLGRQPIAADDIERGPDTVDGPAEGPWTVIAAKSEGVTPGFTFRDSSGQVWFLKFDPPGYRAMATGTEVAATKLLWALGYHVPENYIARLERHRLVMDERARYTPPGRARRAMRLDDIDDLLARAERDPDGSYRVIVSRAVPGRPLGGFKFHGTRPDDPNDVIAHEHRRELRGLGVFAAWLNHVDAKSGNSLDTLISENGRAFVRHYLLDFSSTLGSGSVHPREHWEGFEYMAEPGAIGKGIAAAGFYIQPWRRIPYVERPSIGRVPADHSRWDPLAWRPRVPNAAFIRANADDRFWAARLLAHMRDDLIAAAVRAGRFADEEGERILVRTLVDRRDAILRAYLPAVNPIVDPALGSDGLHFKNAAVDAGVAASPERYRAAWYRFDNAAGTSAPIGETSGTGTTLAVPDALPLDNGSFVRVDVTAEGGRTEWTRPVQLYFRRAASGWSLIGLYR